MFSVNPFVRNCTTLCLERENEGERERLLQEPASDLISHETEDVCFGRVFGIPYVKTNIFRVLMCKTT